MYTRYMYNFCTLHTWNDLHKCERELVGALAWCIAIWPRNCAPVFAAAHFPELSLEMVPTCWFFMTQLSTFISKAFPHVKWPLFHKKVTYFRIPCVRTNQWYFRSQALFLEKEHFPNTLFISLKNSNAENFASYIYFSENVMLAKMLVYFDLFHKFLAKIHSNCEHFSGYFLPTFCDNLILRDINGFIFIQCFSRQLSWCSILILGRLGEQLYGRAEGSFPYCLFPYQKVIGTRGNHEGNSRGVNTEMSSLKMNTNHLGEGSCCVGGIEKRYK